MGSGILFDPSSGGVGAPKRVGQSVAYDPNPRVLAPVVTTASALVLAPLGGFIGSKTRGRLGMGIGIAAGIAGALAIGHLRANSYHPLRHAPVSVDADTVTPLPAPTKGAPTSTGVIPEEYGESDVSVGLFLLDTHSQGLTFWPSWTNSNSPLDGHPRADSSGREDRYGSISDAMGAAAATDGNQAIVERGSSSFALLDLDGPVPSSDSNSGVDVKLHVGSLMADDEDVVKVVEYGDGWLARSKPVDGHSYWVGAAVGE